MTRPPEPSSKPPRRRRRGRASRRAESHRAAHAESQHLPPTKIPDHPLIPSTPHELITDADALQDLIDHVHTQKSFAYDTEFIGEESYHPFICLIQIATTERVALIDPLDGLDVTGIWELVANPDLETIVHAGAQDFEPVVRHLDRGPGALFDTQVAAGFADRPYPLGLHQLVAECTGVRLGKAMTFTNWAKRPLSPVHQQYAADDVRFLPAVRAELRARLEANGNADFVREECTNLTDPSRYRFNVRTQLSRVVGTRSLKAKHLTILAELVQLRDQIAREDDLPPRTVLQDNVLVRIAKDQVRTVPALRAIKGMPWPLAERYGEPMLEAVARGANSESTEFKSIRNPDESPKDRVRIDSLWFLACGLCLGRGIAPSIVTNRREIAQLYFAHRRGRELESTSLASGWRAGWIANALRAVLDGASSVEFRWQDGHLRSGDGSIDPA